jgi:hypothetical protein
MTPDLTALAAEPSRGRRPQFIEDPMVDRLYGITLALVSELAVTRERLDTVERLLARRNVLEEREIDAFAPDAAQETSRQKWHEEYLARVFRVLLQDRGESSAGEKPGGILERLQLDRVA